MFPTTSTSTIGVFNNEAHAEGVCSLHVAHVADHHWSLLDYNQALGAEGVIPNRQIKSFLRDFQQFTHNIPSGKIVGFF